MASDCDMQDVSLDSTSVKVHQYADSKKEVIGRSKGGSITKIHELVNALGYPLRIILTILRDNSFITM